LSSLLSHQGDDYCKLNIAISAIIVDHCAKSRSELSLIYARHFRFGESCATRIATGNLPLCGTVLPYHCFSGIVNALRRISETMNHAYCSFSFTDMTYCKRSFFNVNTGLHCHMVRCIRVVF